MAASGAILQDSTRNAPECTPPHPSPPDAGGVPRHHRPLSPEPAAAADRYSSVRQAPGALRLTGSVYLAGSARAPEVFAVIERHRITHIHVVPALLIRWLNDPATSAYDLGSVRVIQSGGQRLQPETRQRTQKVFRNVTVQENFGMSEGLLMFVRVNAVAPGWIEGEWMRTRLGEDYERSARRGARSGPVPGAPFGISRQASSR